MLPHSNGNEKVIVWLEIVIDFLYFKLGIALRPRNEVEWLELEWHGAEPPQEFAVISSFKCLPRRQICNVIAVGLRAKW